MRRLSLFIAALMVSTSLLAQQKVEDGSVTLRVIPDKAVLKMADTLRVKVEIQNVGREPILLYQDDLCFNPGAGLTLTVRDVSGKILKSSVLLNCFPDRADLPDTERFVRLNSDTFYGRLAHVQIIKLVKKPGDYEFSFQFHATLSKKQVKETFNLQGGPRMSVLNSDYSTIEDKLHIQVVP